MEKWQNYYSKAEQAEIEKKTSKGVKFPTALYQLAKANGQPIPKHARIKACQRVGMPLLKADIQNLTALANGQKFLQPAMSKKKVQHLHAKSIRRQKPRPQVTAKERLQRILRQYDSWVQTGEEIGIMQFEKHRRYRMQAANVLKDPDVTNYALNRQVNLMENQLERLMERVQWRQNNQRFYWKRMTRWLQHDGFI